MRRQTGVAAAVLTAVVLLLTTSASAGPLEIIRQQQQLVRQQSIVRQRQLVVRQQQRFGQPALGQATPQGWTAASHGIPFRPTASQPVRPLFLGVGLRPLPTMPAPPPPATTSLVRPTTLATTPRVGIGQRLSGFVARVTRPFTPAVRPGSTAHAETRPAQPAPPLWAQALAARVPAVDRPHWTAQGLTPTASVSSFIRTRSEQIAPHMEHWVHLAERLMPDPRAPLAPQATRSQASRLFADMEKADIGTNIPEDGCYARADVAAMAGRRAGFEMYKVNVVAPEASPATAPVLPGGRPMLLSVTTPNALSGSVTWRYHVAPAVKVDGELMIIDPSTTKGPVTIAEWKAMMNNPKAQVIVTGADQTWYKGSVLTGSARVEEFAKNLSIVEGVRHGYEPVRAHALVEAARAPL